MFLAPSDTHCAPGEGCISGKYCAEGTKFEDGVCKPVDKERESGVSSGDPYSSGYPSGSTAKFAYKDGVKHDPSCSAVKPLGMSESRRMNGGSSCSGGCTQESKNYYYNRSRKL